MDALRVGTLGARSASLISVMFRSLYGEESAELAVADPVAWGLDKVCLCTLSMYQCTTLSEEYLNSWAKLVCIWRRAVFLPS